MPPTLALLLTLGFMGFLFRRDFRQKPNVTWAVWLPIVWMFLIASKPVTKWLNIFGVPVFGATSVEEGSSLDALVFLTLIGLGIYVLNKRRLSLAILAENNAWLIVFVLYCFLAIFWSDFPLVAFKRWIKVLGHPVMVLVLFTEPDPKEALLRTMKRCAYVLLPVSILWMKYYPTLGRKTSQWGGVTNCGVAGNKNGLGGICTLLGLFFLWHLLQVWRTEKSIARRDELRLIVGLLLLCAYCLKKAHSSTADLSFLLGGMTMAFLGFRFVNKKAVAAYAVTAILLIVIAQLTFDVYGKIVDLTGHSATIQGRGRLWETLLKTDTNPIFGTGFESYWLGDRPQKIWALPEFWWKPTQAHNGYLETYLNLGVVGLSILIGWIVATFLKIRYELLRNFEWGRFQMSCLVAIVAHNWTEAGFKGLTLAFLVFFIIAISYPQTRIASSSQSEESRDAEMERQLVYS